MEEKNSLVSVIVPVYNAEIYLEECVKSIISQSYSNFELLLVDDNSSDSSLQICKRYERDDSRVHVLNNTQKGAAAARMLGVKYASSEYIIFSDADDTMDEKMIESLMEYNSFDLVSSNVKIHNKNSLIIEKKSGIAAGEYISNKELKYFIENMIYVGESNEIGVYMAFYGKLFKKALILKIVDDLDLRIRYGEDRDFLFRYILECKSIKMCGFAYYNYYVRDNSVTNSYDPDFFVDVNRLRDSLSSRFIKSEYSDVLLDKFLKQMKEVYLFGITYKLGIDNKIIKFIPRYIDKNIRKIAVYGAGSVGNSYINYIKLLEDKEIVHWVDAKSYGTTIFNITIESPDTLKDEKYDVVFIALKDEEIRAQIKSVLVEMGINESLIADSAPLELPSWL